MLLFSRRRCLLVAALLTLAPASVWAAATPFAPTLSGIVKLPDGRPAAHVTLQATARRDDFGGKLAGSVESKALFLIHTDGSGRYRTQLIPSDLPSQGDEARFTGFLISPQGAGWAPLHLRVTARNPARRLDIRLRRGDQVQGTVLTYPGGTPAEGVSVYALVEGSGRRPAIVAETRTDRAGHYTIPTSLPPGAYVVGAAADGYGFLAEEQRFPGTPGAARDLTLRLVRDASLHIQVLGADGLALRDHPVTIMVQGDRSNVMKPGSETGRDTRTDAAGAVVYTFHYHETYTPLSKAYRQVSVCVKAGDQTSEQVTIDAMRSSDHSLVLRLQSSR